LWRNNTGVLFDANGTIKWKYASGEFTHEQNHYSQYSYYFLNQTDGTEPMAFPSTKSSAAPSFTHTTFPEHALYEKEESSLCTFGRTLLEGHDYSTGRSRQYNIPLPGTTAGRIRIAVSFGSNATAASTLNISVIFTIKETPNIFFA
jgi:hypothetical protein